eukprot:CAMPEP_0117587180 /NCGR_PEP_ID=MMETSP0784-20121206/69140_1 /TAXON_ID=39447 /ORGANISM="" /LENGTH=67 /DNA_ID=CAMNT_0005388375 /DNA_START=532 /DNA_END=731 /DNA_ORIENTATION=-
MATGKAPDGVGSGAELILGPSVSRLLGRRLLLLPLAMHCLGFPVAALPEVAELGSVLEGVELKAATG